MLCVVSEDTGAFRRPRVSGFHRLTGEMRESFSMAVDSVTAHKLRSGLTLLGILIGVFSIIVVMTILRVLDQTAQDSLADLGPHTFLAKNETRSEIVSPSLGGRAKTSFDVPSCP